MEVLAYTKRMQAIVKAAKGAVRLFVHELVVMLNVDDSESIPDQRG